MKVIRTAAKAGERVIALGTFDGVHRGHQALIAAGKQYAGEHGILLRACSFDRHPLEILRPKNAPKLLTSIPEKAEWMARYGVDELQLTPFTRKTADMAPEEFLRKMRDTVQVRAVVAGWNYTFGRAGAGSAEMLQEDGRIHGYDVLIIPPVRTEDGRVISSSLIRTALRDGNPEAAESMLGHPFEIRGVVADGKHMGHRIGVPTANVEPDARKQLPAFGVYPCRLQTAEKTYAAVLNIGVQPTLPSGKVTAEAHILDGNPELYGQHVRIRIGNRMRPEMKFDSVDDLTEQIRKDRIQAREWLEKHS